MNTLLKLFAVAATLGLVGCQHVTPHQISDAVDPKPPAFSGHVAPMSSAALQPAASATQRRQATSVITLHLAQKQKEDSLVAVDVGGASLYALPQPVLTHADMARVAPVTAQDNRTYVLLEMNQNGIPKLKSITEQARGHHLLLSVQGQLVSVATIGDTIQDGRLLVATNGTAHTQAIIDLMKSD